MLGCLAIRELCVTTNTHILTPAVVEYVYVYLLLVYGCLRRHRCWLILCVGGRACQLHHSVPVAVIVQRLLHTHTSTHTHTRSHGSGIAARWQIALKIEIAALDGGVLCAVLHC